MVRMPKGESVTKVQPAATVAPPASAARNVLRHWPSVLAALMIAASGVLAFARLSDRYLWDDEALVGIVAKNLLNTGHLTGWDGRSLLGYRNGTILDKNLRPINPPLDFYITAASFAVVNRIATGSFAPLDKTKLTDEQLTFAARLPFVLIGLAALAGMWVIAKKLFSDNASRLYALAMLAFSVEFILTMRQCCYYAPAALLSILMFWSYSNCIATKRLWHFAALACWFALLFFASYLLAAAFVLALATHHLLFHRRALTRQDWWKAAVCLVLAVAATIPYAIVYRVWQRLDVPPPRQSWLVSHWTLFYWNLLGLNSQNYLPWILVFAALVLMVLRRGKDVATRPALHLVSLGVLFTLFLSAFSNQPLEEYVGPSTRYLIPAAPFCAGLLWRGPGHDSSPASIFRAGGGGGFASDGGGHYVSGNHAALLAANYPDAFVHN